MRGVMGGALVAAIAIALLKLSAPAHGQATPMPAVPIARLLGQRIMVSVVGTKPSASLLARARAGQIGGVILFAYNIVNQAQVSALTGALQRAARAGGNPPLLISIDQEGGQVKRFPNGPPFLSPPQIAARGSTSVAFKQGAMTGAYLRARGINMDLAPVLDVPTSSRAFIWQQGRAFSFSASAVARFGGQFALESSRPVSRLPASIFRGLARPRSTPTTAVRSCTPRALSARRHSSPTRPDPAGPRRDHALDRWVPGLRSQRRLGGSVTPDHPGTAARSLALRRRHDHRLARLADRPQRDDAGCWRRSPEPTCCCSRTRPLPSSASSSKRSDTTR